MIKTISLIWAKEGISRGEFRRYYEDIHVPLIMTIFPMLTDYTRIYPVRSSACWTDGLTRSGWSALAMLKFPEDADYDIFLERVTNDEVLKIIRADEMRFCDPSGVFRFRLEEGPGSMVKTERDIIKVIGLIKNKLGVSREEFRKSFEVGLPSFRERFGCTPIAQTVSFPDLRGARLPEGHTDAPFDAMIEAWFRTESQTLDFIRRFSDAGIGDLMRMEDGTGWNGSDDECILIEEEGGLGGHSSATAT